MADSVAKKAAEARKARQKERFPKVEMLTTKKGRTVGSKIVKASKGTKKIVREAANGKPSTAKKIEEFFVGPKKLTAKQEREANAMQTRRYVDKSKTAMRANIIESRNKKKTK
jgi:hypothetical protein